MSGVPAAGIRTPLRLWLDAAKFSGLPSSCRFEFLFSTTAGELTVAAGTNGLQKVDRSLGWQHLNGALICVWLSAAHQLWRVYAAAGATVLLDITNVGKSTPPQGQFVLSFPVFCPPLSVPLPMRLTLLSG